MRPKKRLFVYSYPSMQDLADRVMATKATTSVAYTLASASSMGQSREIRNSETMPFAYEHDVVRGVCNWGEYESGWPYLVTNTNDDLEGADIVYFAEMAQPSDIFTQYAHLCALARSGARSLNICLPFFPVGTDERVTEPGQVATAKSLWRLLSSIPSCDSGQKPRLIVFDIHALQEQFYPTDDLALKLLTAMPLLRERLNALEVEEGICSAVAFPDAGARKRFGGEFTGRDTYLLEKVRKRGERPRVVIKEGDPRGEHVVLVDDLVLGGGTGVESARVLLDAGAASVSAFFTHFSPMQEAYRRFTPDIFRHVWMTNSCSLTVGQVAGLDHFEVIDLRPILVDYINQLLYGG